jgi:hypothetical protein
MGDYCEPGHEHGAGLGILGIHLNPDVRIILSAVMLDHTRAMYEAGASDLILLHVETARVCLEVLEAVERDELDDLREQALADLAHRQEMLA